MSIQFILELEEKKKQLLERIQQIEEEKEDLEWELTGKQEQLYLIRDYLDDEYNDLQENTRYPNTFCYLFKREYSEKKQRKISIAFYEKGEIILTNQNKENFIEIYLENKV